MDYKTAFYGLITFLIGFPVAYLIYTEIYWRRFDRKRENIKQECLDCLRAYSDGDLDYEPMLQQCAELMNDSKVYHYQTSRFAEGMLRQWTCTENIKETFKPANESNT